MARIRTIRPEFFLDEDLVTISPLARLFFIGLWQVADREGRIEDRAGRLKMQILPCDECNGEAMMQELEGIGNIVRYEVEGQRYLEIVNFKKYQNPHPKEKPSTLPAVPCKGMTKPRNSTASREKVSPSRAGTSGTSGSLEGQEHPPTPQPKPAGQTTAGDFKVVQKAYETAIGGLVPNDAFPSLMTWCRMYPTEKIVGWIEHCAARDKTSLTYIGACLSGNDGPPPKRNGAAPAPLSADDGPALGRPVEVETPDPWAAEATS